MRKATLFIAVLAMLIGTLGGTAFAEHDPNEPLADQCPGANEGNAPAVPDGLEIVLDNDATEGLDQNVRNDTVLDAGTLVCIKGGPKATGIIIADGTSTLQELLGHYVTVGQDNVPDVSYFMTYRVTEEQGQWCSPGYWRQPHHLDSWEATGIAPGELYSAHFGAAPALSKKGVSDGASTDPTLLQVLQAPQHYGGDAFNNVGDLLSAAHPDVDFDGERVEDSCPLD